MALRGPSRTTIWLRFSLTMLALSAVASASVHVSTYGASEEHCQPAYNKFVDTVERVPFPDDWTVVVVCSDVAWQVALLATRSEGRTEMALTNRKHRWTLVNGAVWDPLRNRSRYTPEMVLRHELGHILCECRDEERANEAGGVNK